MAARARLIGTYDVAAACARVTAPTLVVTGEPHLDHVVPVDGSSHYGTLLPRAERAVLERTGHQGTLTRPQAFAAIAHEFAQRVHHAAAGAPRAGRPAGSAPRRAVVRAHDRRRRTPQRRT